MLLLQKLDRYTRILFAVLTLGSVMLLQGCFWQSDDDPAPTPTPDANPTGYYSGKLTVQTFTDETTVHALINDNRLMLMSIDQGVLYDGTMVITGNSFTSTAKIYDDGTDTAATTVITGTIDAGSQIRGELTGGGIGSGTFTLTYSLSVNGETADVSRITTDGKIWEEVLYDVTNANLAFTVSLPTNLVHDDHANAGVFNFCSIDAGATIASIPSTSLYSVNLTFTGCTTSPLASTSYSGLATTKSILDTNLIMMIAGSGFAVIGEFDKN